MTRICTEVFSMKNTMEYKGYIGSVEFEEEKTCFFGKVLGITTPISYEGESAWKLITNFHSAVDDYLAQCKKEGTLPEVAYTGTINLRIAPELHKQAALAALSMDVTLNQFIEFAVQSTLK